MRTMQVVGLALGMAAAANAQEAGHGADVPPFAELDADQNGYVTETEASKVPAVIEVFAELDADGDARLDADEYGKLAETR
ncbi:MAG TPA: hypothetical protein VLD39_00615 [Gammaproteobacteria bacterium]|nr:hypothetical protein [Gammaproteobacteria bacterium]